MRRFVGFLILITCVLLLMLTSLSPPTASSLQTEPTATPAGEEIDDAPTEDVALVVVLSTADLGPPKAKSTVMVMTEDGQAVAIGAAENGIFRATVPEGVYDIAVLLQSFPQAAVLERDVIVSAGDDPLTLVVPPEETLSVSVRTANGNPPKQAYTVEISNEEVKVTTKANKALTSGDNDFVLRGDLLYDVLVTYDDLEVMESGVSAGEEGELAITLPADEGTVDIFLRDSGGPLAENARVVVLDENGREMAANAAVLDKLTVYLPAGAVYTVMAQYQAIAAEGSVAVKAGGLHPLTLDFAEEGSFTPIPVEVAPTPAP